MLTKWIFAYTFFAAAVKRFPCLQVINYNCVLVILCSGRQDQQKLLLFPTFQVI